MDWGTILLGVAMVLGELLDEDDPEDIPAGYCTVFP